MALVAPIIVLLASGFVIYLFILKAVILWLDVTTFWNRVAFRQRRGDNFSIEYSFTMGKWYVVGFVAAVPAMLWSVIKLAALL